MMTKRLVMAACGLCGLCAAEGSAPFRTADDGRGGVLGYAEGTRLLESDGLRFKDLNRNGLLDPYEDWRLGADARAQDLAAKLTLDDIFGLMLYSTGQWLGGAAVTKDQRKFLVEDRVRHVLVAKVPGPREAAEWNNAVQALVERTGFGVPANNSSDPRHQPVADVEYSPGAGGKISMWPGFLAMAATFDPEIVRSHAEIAAREYRALGIATALSPQADIATEPRWRRFNQTYGESPELAAEMVRAYGDGFQTTPGAADGWGRRSVNAMVKHWPGGGPGEAGRDAHFGRGKYAVYPGNGLARQKLPFVSGAFALRGGTKTCSAVMPYYTVAWGQTSDNLANGFSREMIQEQLRDALGYDGVVCTDWHIVHDEPHPNRHDGKPWGMDYASVAERHLKCWLAGVDQFGGCNDAGPVREAFEIGCRRHGRVLMERIVRTSAARLLKNIFRTGLFENPYVDPAETERTVGCGEFMKAGYEAQVKSVVMVKNRGGALPLKGGRALKVYVPDRTEPEHESFWGRVEKTTVSKPVAEAIVAKFFTPVASAAEADAAVVFVRSPVSGWGYSEADAKAGGNGYVPISLQYEPYTAEFARAKSLAGGDKFELTANRSYRGKSVKTSNVTDLEQVLRVRRELGPGKPLVVVLNVANPTVPDKMEQAADAFLVVSDIQNQAVFDILSGAAEPSGLLPFQMPADMRTVEEQCEDLPYDMRPYVDADGNAWDFAFGLNWSGRIDDERTRRAARWRAAARDYAADPAFVGQFRAGAEAIARRKMASDAEARRSAGVDAPERLSTGGGFDGYFLWDTAFACVWAAHTPVGSFPAAASLDNLYRSASADGFICREYTAGGEAVWSAEHPNAFAPPLLAWAERELFVRGHTDRARLERVYPILAKHHAFCIAHYRRADGLYFGDMLGCGMDDLPRGPVGVKPEDWPKDGGIAFSSEMIGPSVRERIAGSDWFGRQLVYRGWNRQAGWIDLSAQMAFDAANLAWMARELGRDREAAAYDLEHGELADTINRLCWDEQTGFYYDRGPDGLIRRRLAAAFWTLIAGVATGDRARQLAAAATDERWFGRPCGVPALAADDPDYDPEHGYWCGPVWPPVAYMTIRGLLAAGFRSEAETIARRWYNASAALWEGEGTCFENISPEQCLRRKGRSGTDFCGWAALAPVALPSDLGWGL